MSAMDGEAIDVKIKEQILRYLRVFSPIRVDEVAIVSAVHKGGIDDVSIDQISKCIRSLRDDGWIEELIVKAPFRETELFQFRITSSGIELLSSMGSEGMGDYSATLVEIKSRLEETSDGIEADMENIRQDMEKSKKELEGSIEGVRKEIADISKELALVKELVDKYAGKAEAEMIREEHLILRILSENEKAIYDLILNANGEMLQKDLVARAKMSNAKISRTVDHLESRGILTKERFGATNRLRIRVNPP